MSGRSTSVLANYNPLTDPHLAAHYSSRRRRKQLRSAGLIKRNGEIVSNREYVINNQTKETKTHMKDLLTQAVVQKALELERHRQVSIRDQLELMAKKERVRRIRAERSKSDLNISYQRHQSAPRGKSAKESTKHSNNVENGENAESEKSAKKDVQSKNQKINYSASKKVELKKISQVKEMDYHTLKMIKKEVDRQKAFGPGPSPFSVDKADVDLVSPSPRMPKSNSIQVEDDYLRNTQKKKSSGSRLHRAEPGMIVKVRQQSMCEMKYKYVGRPGIGETAFLDPEDVVIEQQHCGGETIKVYHGLLKPGDKLTFVSRRHRGYPFSFVMYVNSIRVERISSCCEYRFKKGSKLGTGTLQFLSVSGAAPCFRCNVRKGLIKDKPDPAPRPRSRLDSPQEPPSSAPRSHSNQNVGSPRPESSSSSSSSSESSGDESDQEKNDVPVTEVNNDSDNEIVDMHDNDKRENEDIEGGKSDAESVKSDPPSSDDESDVKSVQSESSSSSSSDSQTAEISKEETTDEQPVTDRTITEPITITEPESVTEPLTITESETATSADLLRVQTLDDTPRSSPGLTSPMASELVNDVLNKITTDDQTTVTTETLSTTDSPTSPFANKMVDDLIETIKSEGNTTARSDQSETITQVTDGGNDDTKSEHSFTTDSYASSDSETTQSETNHTKSY